MTAEKTGEGTPRNDGVKKLLTAVLGMTFMDNDVTIWVIRRNLERCLSNDVIVRHSTRQRRMPWQS